MDTLGVVNVICVSYRATYHYEESDNKLGSRNTGSDPKLVKFSGHGQTHLNVTKYLYFEVKNLLNRLSVAKNYKYRNFHSKIIYKIEKKFNTQRRARLFPPRNSFY